MSDEIQIFKGSDANICAGTTGCDPNMYYLFSPDFGWLTAGPFESREEAQDYLDSQEEVIEDDGVDDDSDWPVGDIVYAPGHPQSSKY